MKKLLIIISSILILTILAITVSAAGAVATVDNKSCAKGGTVTLNVTVSGSANALSGSVEVIYDKTVLELVEAKWHTDGALLSNFDKATDKGAFAYQTSKSISGKVFSVTFKVLDNAPVGKTDVECNIQLKDGSNNISVTNNKGSINVTCKHNFNEKNNEFLASKASCASPARYYYACSICGEKGTATYTVGSALSHTFDKKVATSTYLVKNVTCVDEAEYYYSCSCGAKGTEKFTADASWSHNFSENWFISADGHWHQCLDCGAKKDSSSHIADDGVCSVCKFVLAGDAHAHSFTTTKHDSVGHWSECNCGERINLAFHTYGEWVVNGDKQSQNCSICGYVNTIYVPNIEENHTHSFVTIKYDSIGHWSECSCGEKSDLAFHTYGDWDVNGDKQSRMCSVCSYVNTINVPVEEDNEDKEDDPVVDNNNDVVDDTENNSNSLVVGIISAVSAIAITLIADFAIREILKKSKVKPETISEETSADEKQENTEENENT